MSLEKETGADASGSPADKTCIRKDDRHRNGYPFSVFGNENQEFDSTLKCPDFPAGFTTKRVHFALHRV